MFRRSWIPYCVIAVSLLATAMVIAYIHRSAGIHDDLRLQTLIQRTRDTLERRVDTYVALLRSGGGFFAGSLGVTREEFKRFVDHLELKRRYPGIQGIGFSQRIPKDQKEEVVASLQKEIKDDFKIWPEGDREEYHSIIFLEPLDRRNQAAIGFDMFTELVRRIAMVRARDSGFPTASGRVTLVQEIDDVKQAGFLIYMPIYRPDRVVTTIEERNEALEGFVYSPFRADDFMRDVLDKETSSSIMLEVFSGGEAVPGGLLHRSSWGVNADGLPARFTRITQLEVAGTTWTLRFQTLPAFDRESSLTHIPSFLIAGLILSGLLFFLTRSQVLAQAASMRAAKDLDRSEIARRQSEAHFRELVELSPEAIFIETGGDFAFVNHALVKLLGAQCPEELIGKPVLNRVHPEFREAVRERMRLLHEERQATSLLEQKWIRTDGTVLTVEVTAAPFTHEGKPGSQAIIRDISQRKVLEAQLMQAQKMEAVGRLAGGVAHDFNNLLTAILGYSELIMARLDRNNPLYDELQEIHLAGKRASNLTHQLLAFSRRQVLMPKVLDLNVIVSDIDRMLHRLIGEHIELITRTQSDLGRIKADPGQVEQVIMNLAVNARDAMSQGGRLTIETRNVDLDKDYARTHSEAKAGAYVMLAVSDTGIGMDSQTQARIFEPFYTTKDLGRGTGLGLSTVYGIVKQSKGHIWVYSELGRGSTFKVYLPRVDDRAEAYKSDLLKALPKGGTETILVAEDEDVVRRLACSALRAHGYTVIEARNGPDALSVAQNPPTPIQLMITDMVMPGMNGRELAAKLTGTNPAMKVLYMSGYTEDAMIHQGELSEDTEFLSKPFTPELLLRRVREVLDAA